MSLIKKENIVIVNEYKKSDGSIGKQYKTIGELVTMQGNDGPYQFGQIWGPHGFTEIKVYPQQDKQQAHQGINQAQQVVQQAPQGYQNNNDDIPGF